jgi:hypothetical protein
MNSSLFSMAACKAFSLALLYYSYVFCCMSLDEMDVATLFACMIYETQLTIKCVNVSVAIRMNSLKNCRMTFVVILAIVLFLICENVVSTISECMKFLLSLKHLSLFFLISSKERGRRSAREVEREKVVKKLDSRFTT